MAKAEGEWGLATSHSPASTSRRAPSESQALRSGSLSHSAAGRSTSASKWAAPPDEDLFLADVLALVGDLNGNRGEASGASALASVGIPGCVGHETVGRVRASRGGLATH